MSTHYFYNRSIPVHFDNQELHIFASSPIPRSATPQTRYWAASSDGMIWVSNDTTNWTLKPQHAAIGSPYRKVSIMGDTLYVHRIIALIFCEKPIYWQTMDIDHIDSNKANNNASNLAFVSHQENAAKRATRRPAVKGTILAINIQNGRLYTYESQQQASLGTGLSQSGISTCLRNKRKTLGGLIFCTPAEYQLALEALNATEVAV